MQLKPFEPGIPNGKIFALTCDGNGNLYAGGQFDTAGTVAASNIAKWDGEKWNRFGTGVNNGVYALECDNQGNLYAGGWFDTAGGVFADHIARWDGTGWSSFGTGVPSGRSDLRERSCVFVPLKRQFGAVIFPPCMPVLAFVNWHLPQCSFPACSSGFLNSWHALFLRIYARLECTIPAEILQIPPGDSVQNLQRSLMT